MNSDFKDLLVAFKEHRVKFLIVGGYALVEYTEPRFTKDLDIWIGADNENGARAHAALSAFGAPLSGATPQDLATAGNVLQIGMPPCRIDVLTSIDGVNFEEAWHNRLAVDFDGVEVDIISLRDLIKNKESTSRARDKEDAKLLRAALSMRKA